MAVLVRKLLRMKAGATRCRRSVLRPIPLPQVRVRVRVIG
jgi:hypothetical protein